MQSVNILAESLQNYQGSYLVVSHDRHFISKIANKIWYIEGQQVKEYPGTYAEYSTWMEEKNATSQQPNIVTQKAKQKPKVEEKKEPIKQLSREEQKELSRKVSKAKKLVAELERKIDQLEQQKKQLEDEMAKPSVYGNPDLLADTSQKYEQSKLDLEKLNDEWAEAAMELEELEG